MILNRGPNDTGKADNVESVWTKLIPMIIFAFFFFGLVVFLLNRRIPHQHNKYYNLVFIFRGIAYGLFFLLAIVTWRSMWTEESFEEREKKAHVELKKKIARFIRD